jgi:2'-5' RNA ligase
MRAFVAIPIDERLRDGMVAVQEALRRAAADVRWVERENLHVSLKFLGEIDETQHALLAERLRGEATRFPPLELEFAGVGRFPSGGAPRVLWIGCRRDVSKLAGLADAVERAAADADVPRENRPYAAHVTIGRVRSPANKQRLLAALEARRDDVIGRQRVEAFALYRSTLTPEGPIYEALERFPLVPV